MNCKFLTAVLVCLAALPSVQAQYDRGNLEYPVPMGFGYGGFWAADLEPPRRSYEERCWGRFEYLLWWEKDGPTPGPLVTTGPPSAAPGVLGRPGTTVLFGDEGLDYRAHSGGMFTVGAWFDRNACFGFEVGGLLVETHTIHFEINSDRGGSPVIARPFFNVLTGTEDAQVLTAPGSFFGGIDVFSDSKFWGGEANLLRNLQRGERGRLDLIGGFRYFGLDESLRISQSSTVFANGIVPPPGFLGAPVPIPDILSITDRVDTRNEFYGGQLGLRATIRANRLSTELTGKVGLGVTNQSVELRGVTELTGPTGRIGIVPAGLYTVGDNLGTHSRRRLSFISEVGVRCGFDLTDSLTLHIGGMLLYWGEIARPGEQLNRNLNPQVVPSNLAFGPVTAGPEPVRRFASSDYWAGGLNLGVTVHY